MLCGPQIIIARNSSCRKVMFSQVCVIPFVHGGGSMQYSSMQLGRGCVSKHAIGQGVSQHAIGQGWGCVKGWW